MSKLHAVSTFAFLCCAICSAQTSPGLVVGNHSSLEWKAPGSLPPGAEYHLIFEDPKSHAVQFLARFKSRYDFATHHHSYDETIVVVKGKLIFESAAGKTALGPGSYVRIPAKEPHALRTGKFGGCEIMVSMKGPFDALGMTPAR
ncbi:MAG: cupin domain-containing protein [Elusimicrobia bacterium]|nr:cupin domain-containing protein [Elusimicrobiota bacterium]